MSSRGSTTAATPADASPIRYDAQPRSSWMSWRKITCGDSTPGRAGSPPFRAPRAGYLLGVTAAQAEQPPGRHVSVWLDGPAGRSERPQRDLPPHVEVAVVGGGITGVTAALLLARAGRSVALLDQNTIGSGTTGHSTAKVTSQHGLTYALLRLT